MSCMIVPKSASLTDDVAATVLGVVSEADACCVSFDPEMYIGPFYTYSNYQILQSTTERPRLDRGRICQKKN